MLSILLLKGALVCGVLAGAMTALVVVFGSLLDAIEGKLSHFFTIVVLSLLFASVILGALLVVGAFGAFVFDVRV